MKELSISKTSIESRSFTTTSFEMPQFNQLKANWTYRDSKSVYSTAELKKQLYRLAEIAYYQAGKIVVQTFLPLHPPVALVTLDYSGITTSTFADTHITIDNELNSRWSSFLEARLIGLYGGKATSLLINQQHLISCPTAEIKLWTDIVARKDKIHFFQSNIGIQEIKTATSLASAMVDNWIFSGLSSTELKKSQCENSGIFSRLQPFSSCILCAPSGQAHQTESSSQTKDSPVQPLGAQVTGQKYAKTKLNQQIDRDTKDQNKFFERVQSSVEKITYTKSIECIKTKFITRFSREELYSNVIFDNLCQWQGKWEQVVSYLGNTFKSSLTPVACLSTRVYFLQPLQSVKQENPQVYVYGPTVGWKEGYASSVLPLVQEKLANDPQLLLAPKGIQLRCNSKRCTNKQQLKMQKKQKTVFFVRSSISLSYLLNSIDCSITRKKNNQISAGATITICATENSTDCNGCKETKIKVNDQSSNKVCKLSYPFFVNICQSYIQSKGFVSKNSEEIYYSSLEKDKPLPSLQLYVRYFNKTSSEQIINALCATPVVAAPLHTLRGKQEQTNTFQNLWNKSINIASQLTNLSDSFRINNDDRLKKQWNAFRHSYASLLVQPLQPFCYSFYSLKGNKTLNTKPIESVVVSPSILVCLPTTSLYTQPVHSKIVQIARIVPRPLMFSSFINGVGTVSALQFSIIHQDQGVAFNACTTLHLFSATSACKDHRLDSTAQGDVKDCNDCKKNLLDAQKQNVVTNPLQVIPSLVEQFIQHVANKSRKKVLGQAYTTITVCDDYMVIGKNNNFPRLGDSINQLGLLLPEKSKKLLHLVDDKLPSRFFPLSTALIVFGSLNQLFQALKNYRFYSPNRISVENFETRSLSVHSSSLGTQGTNTFHLINPLHSSISQRNRFYPDWFRLYLPDMEATEFMKNVANCYSNLELQTLVRPSLNEFTRMFLEICEMQSTLSTTFYPLIELSGRSLEYGHTGNFLRIMKFPLSFSASIATFGCTAFSLPMHQRCKNQRFLQAVQPKVAMLALKRSTKDAKQGKKREQNLILCCGNNNLSIGVGLLRSAAKRRTLLNIKNQSFFLNAIKSATRRISKQIAYPGISTTLWGFSKPWNVNRIIDISFPQETGQHNSMQLYRVIKEKDSTFSFSSKDFLFAKISKKMNKSFHLLGACYIIEKCSGLVTRQVPPFPNTEKYKKGFCLPSNPYATLLERRGMKDTQEKTHVVQSVHSVHSPSVQSKISVRFVTELSHTFRHAQMMKLQNQRFYSQYQYDSLNSINSEKSFTPKTRVGALSSLSTSQPLKRKVAMVAQVIRHQTKLKNTIKSSHLINDNPINCCYNRGLLYDKFVDNRSVNKPNRLDTSLFFSLEKQIFPTSSNDVSGLEKELIYHSFITACFSKAFFLINQNRQLTDYFADYLIRFKILRQHQILYLFSTVLFSCKKL